MRILWLRADYLFPLTTGSRNRSFSLLKRICHEAELVYAGYSPIHGEQSDEALSCCVKSLHCIPKDIETTRGTEIYLRVAANVLSRYPFFARRSSSPELREYLAGIIAEKHFDLLLCDGLDASLNVDFSWKLPKVLFHHSIETPLWRQRYESATNIVQRTYFNYETKRTAAFESDMCNRFDSVITSSDRDRDALVGEYHVTRPISVVPIGVDCSYFKPDPAFKTIPHRLVFSGKMDVLSNIDRLLWFVSEIYPLVRHRFPDITFDIVGRNPASEIVALGQKDRSIRVTGWLEDIRPYVGQADIFVVPLRVPGGTRVKLYEAMALQRPVVSTSYGAEGLEVVANRDLLIADTPREFAGEIIGLLENPQRKMELAERGWRMVNANCDWSARAGQFFDVLRACAALPIPD